MSKIRTEWHTMKEKWFQGETIDPVFEGVVRDFCVFDEAMHGVKAKVESFMTGVEKLAGGMIELSDGVSSFLSTASDHQIASDSCKLKEATNQIARNDAPHSAIAKLRRDMMFNIVNPVQAHISNNKNLKVSLDVRRRRLAEYTSAKKQFDECSKKGLSQTDRRYLQAQSNLEAAKTTFTDVDRHVFEWLYILEDYRGDILDSTLQTLKYLQYEFFATSAHAVSQSLPSRMEFRPMVEMTPDHLEVQVELELQTNEDSIIEGSEGGPGAIADFSLRLIEKKAKEDPEEHAVPAAPVDPLSLSSLLSQGFEEGPARRALRLHNNDTQAAMDWLIDGGTEEAIAAKKVKALEEGVRMPTTVKRVQRLKAMRKKRQEKEKGSSRRGSRDRDDGEGGRRSSTDTATVTTPNRGNVDSNSEQVDASSDRECDTSGESDTPPACETPADLLDMNEASAPAPHARDLLGFDSEEPAVPTDFSKPLEMAPLPQLDLLYDEGARCEKQPLASSVAAGIAMPRAGATTASDELLGLSAAPPIAPAPAHVVDALAGYSPELLAQAAAQLQASQAANLASAQAAQAATPPMGLYNNTSQGSMQPLGPATGLMAAPAGLEALDPFNGIPLAAVDSQARPSSDSLRTSGNVAASNGAASTTETDEFSGLVGLVTPNS